MQFQFEHPLLLFLLWLVPAIALLLAAAFRRSERRLENFVSAAMRARLSPPRGRGRFAAQLALLALALGLVLIAMARPRWGMRDERVFQRGRDLVIAVDVSQSMLARDVHPTRLHRAKADLTDLLRELRGDRAAIIAFRSKAVQVCPLTTDYAFLEYALDALSPESAPRGETDIGDAIDKAVAAFETDSGSHRAMILISDGEDLAGSAIAAAERAKDRGVAIFTVGLGDAGGSRIPSSGTNDFLKFQGADVVTRLENETLIKLAEITGGAYVPVGVGNVRLGTLYKDHLRKLASIDNEEAIQRRAIERFQVFLLPAVLALFAIAFLSRGRMPMRARPAPWQPLPGAIRGSPANPKMTAGRGSAAAGCLAFLLALGCAPASMAADETGQVAGAASDPVPASNAPAPAAAVAPARQGRDAARRAQELYALGRYEESAKMYLDALSSSSLRLQEDFLFNAACALYKAGSYEAAADRFKELVSRSDNGIAPNANYNMGCALFQAADKMPQGTNAEADASVRLEALEKAGRAFQQSLRRKPDFAAAKRNLAVVADAAPGARERLRTARLMARYGNMPPARIAGELLRNQRSVLEQLETALTNAGPSRIGQFESIAALQKENAEIIHPLRAGLLNAVQSQASQPGATQAVANIQLHLDALGNVMLDASSALRDLDESAAGPAADAQKGAFLLWRMIADYAELIREDILLQSNALAQTRAFLTNAPPAAGAAALGTDLAEARALTGLFSERFALAFPSNAVAGAAGAPGAAQESPGATNEPPMTPEKREKILALARDAENEQVAAVNAMSSTNLPAAIPHESKALDLLLEIEKLLPRDQNQDQQQNQDQKQDQDQQQNQDQQKNQEKDKKEDGGQDQDKQDSKQESKPEPEQEQQPEQPQPKPEPEKNGD
ncbi:MAG: VWA domain-containing protein, partial [Lentisphaerae bacterium]|nr:VWA domain-containing protein [Lentisphaerota bacterium]